MGQSELGTDDLPLLRPRRGVPRIRRVDTTTVEAGTTIEGFRIERRIGGGSSGVVYEATQLSLRRRVAFRLIDAGQFAAPEELARFDHEQRLAAAIHHPNLVTCFAAGEWERGRFVAMRLIRGCPLSELSDAGTPLSAGSLAPIADALDAAHAQGLAHGRVHEGNVLVDAAGTPHLADLGLARGGSPDRDSRDLAALIERLPERAAVTRTRRASRPLRLALAAAAAAAVVALVVALGGGDDPAPVEPPEPLAGTQALGSDLAAPVIEPRGCAAEPSPNTPACTLAQQTVDGAAPRVSRDGVIRRWAVRGASGELALQVIRERGGRAFAVGFTQLQPVPEQGAVTLPAEIAVRRGDRIAVQLGPGATIGASAAPADSSIARWNGGLTATPQAIDATEPGAELMVRADVEYGARVEGPPQLLRDEAASAPAGRELDQLLVSLPDGRPARVVVVAIDGGVAIDLFRGDRVARLTVPDADVEGELLDLSQACGRAGPLGFCLRWENPGEELAFQHAYAVGPSGRLRLVG